MRMLDNYANKRNPEGYIVPSWFWEHSDLNIAHRKNIIGMYRLEEASAYEQLKVLDTWALHSGVVMIMGHWYLDVASEPLLAVGLSIESQDAMQLPYMVFGSTSDEAEKNWWQHPISRNWSPLKWWFANREEQAKVFTRLCARHLSLQDWHLAGISWQTMDYSVLCNLLHLSRSQLNGLSDQASLQPNAF